MNGNYSTTNYYLVFYGDLNEFLYTHQLKLFIMGF